MSILVQSIHESDFDIDRRGHSTQDWVVPLCSICDGNFPTLDYLTEDIIKGFIDPAMESLYYSHVPAAKDGWVINMKGR